MWKNSLQPGKWAVAGELATAEGLQSRPQGQRGEDRPTKRLAKVVDRQEFVSSGHKLAVAVGAAAADKAAAGNVSVSR